MHEVIIIGGGPAGLTASIYSSCFHLNHVVIAQKVGGQLLLAPDILNYPGFMEISGLDLTKHMSEQVKKLGGVITEDLVVSIDREANNTFLVKTQKDQTFQSKAIILATGTERRKLNVSGENNYIGRGVHYCAICDKQDYEEKTVAVIGGGNAAAQSAVTLAYAAAKVFILYRGSELKSEGIWNERILKAKNITVLFNTTISEIIGDGKKVTGVKMEQNQGQKTLNLDGVFIEIGGVPGTSLVAPLGVTLDPGGYIIVDDKLATSVPGVFAAGDLVSYGLSIEQISSAVGLGARAAASAFSYLKQGKAPSAWGQALIKRQ